MGMTGIRRDERDLINILRDIAIFIFGPFGLKLPIHAHFGGI